MCWAMCKGLAGDSATANFRAGLAEGSSDKLGHQFCAVMFDLLRLGNLNTSPQESKRNNLQSKRENELFSTAEIAARKIEAGHRETLLNSKNSEELK